MCCSEWQEGVKFRATVLHAFLSLISTSLSQVCAPFPNVNFSSLIANYAVEKISGSTLVMITDSNASASVDRLF